MSNGNDTLRGWGGSGSDVRLGLDVGDKASHWAAVDLTTGEVREGVMGTTREAVNEVFGGAVRCTVVLEAGTHSPWLARRLHELGHRAVVVDSAILRAGHGRRRRKSDCKDAVGLREAARDVGRPRVKELWQRPEEYQLDVSLMRLRDAVVRSRTLVANAVRGTVKSLGERIEHHSVESLPTFARQEVTEGTRRLIEPALVQIEQATEALKGYEDQVDAYLARRPESARLLQVHGVGRVTVGVFMAVIGDPRRFRHSRDVAAYLGLTPGEDQSGDENRQLRITKAGDELARRTLVQCAHFMMSRRGQDSDLRRWALKLAGDGNNPIRKKKATVALARKLATLLHQLWLTGSEYRPLSATTDQDPALEAA